MAQKRAFASLLKTKLSLITSQKEELYGTIDAHTDKVTATVRTALEAQDQDLSTLTDLSSVLETVLVFIAGVGAYVDDTISQSRAEEPGAPNAKQMEEKSKDIETILSDSVKQQESRLRTVEDSISQADLRVSAKMEDMKISLMAHMEQRINELEKKQTDNNTQYNMRFDDIKEELKQMDTRGTDMMKQCESRLDKVEKQMKKLEVAEKQDASRLDNVVRDIDTLRSQHSKRQQSPKLDSVAKQVETLSTQCCSLQEQLQDTQNLKQTVDDLASRLGILADKSDLIDVMKANRETKNSLQDVTSRLDAVESSVRSSLSYKEKEENKRREMEDRVLVLESNRSKDLDHFAKKLNEVECQFKQVCYIVDSKVTPLRHLLRLLNELHKKVEKREEISQRLDELTKQVADISSQVTSSGTQGQQAPVGFTAYFPGRVQVTQDSFVCAFSDVICNEGSHFDPSTGTFTAPHDGLYVTAVCLEKVSGGEVEANVFHKRGSDGVVRCVCCSGTNVNRISSCGVGIVNLKAGDKLYVYLATAAQSPHLNNYSSFSCFSIG